VITQILVKTSLGF